MKGCRMNFGLSMEISKGILVKSPIITRISKVLESHFRNKNYGEGVSSLTIGIICVRAKAGAFFPAREKYTRSEGKVEYDVVLDYEAVKTANEPELRRMLCEKIVSSTVILQKMAISDFDIDKFKLDLEKIPNALALD
jgi:hypothetical protein